MIRRNWIALLLMCGLVTFALRMSAQQHPNLEKGFKADQAYAVSDIDVVNLFNGNLNVSVPIGGTYPVGGNLSYGFTIAYAGNNWDYESDDQAVIPTYESPPASPVKIGRVVWAVPYKNLNAGMGWLFSLGRLFLSSRVDTETVVYQAPDGSEHAFYSDLHGQNDGTIQPNISYTRDGTYIRRTVVPGSATILEFPDGTIKEFFGGRLQKIRDRFGNIVTIDSYASAQDATNAGIPSPDGNACGTSYVAWKIKDAYREHYVYFLPSSPAYAPFIEERVCEADLAAFGGDRAKYLFTYTERAISRQKVNSPEYYYESERPSATLPVPLLSKISLPSGSSYEMVYDAGLYKPAGSAPAAGVRSDSSTIPNQLSDGLLSPGGFSGHLIEVRAPTKGLFGWTYRRYIFPPDYDHISDPIDPSEKFVPTISAGVATRTKYLDTGPAVWEYKSSFLSENSRTVAITTVNGPDGSSTENYFSLFMADGVDRTYDYGAPYTRRPDTNNPYKEMYLSSQTKIPGTTAKRRTYVTYEWDPVDFQISKDTNRRLKSRLTVLEDGSETSEVSSDYDGLGHYRTTTINGTAGPVKRVITQTYNPPAGAVRIIDNAGTPWLTETYSATNTEDRDQQDAVISRSRTEFCFDGSTGALLRTRALRGANPSTNDLLAVFSDKETSADQADGNVSKEQYYGGDTNGLGNAFDTCAGLLTSLTPSYDLRHLYSFGTRSSTKYDGLDFKILSLNIDASTGLPSAAVDPAGVTMAMTYDVLGRITSLQRSGQARSTYEYVEATDTAGPSIAVRHECPSDGSTCSASALPEARYYYDSFGRLIQQRSSMGTAGTSPWSAVAMSTTFTATGSTKTTSVPVGVSSGALSVLTPPGTTQWDYDSLGRTTTIKQPDASEVTFAYPSPNAVVRTAKISIASGSAAVTTTEESDALGRLVKVTEDSAGTSPIVTSYQYDAGGRLSTVVAGDQTRTFEYDGAGMLKMEEHPESGTTHYNEYDARGHVMKRTANDQSTLRYAYDSAERLTFVWHDPAGAAAESLMKEFTFGTTGNAKGRLLTAKRHNDHPFLGGDATVTEMFEYDATGLVSSKTTTVSIPNRDDRTFVDSYTYDELGATKTVIYPGCSDCGLTEDDRVVENFYEHGYLKRVGGYTSDRSYHPNGMWKQFSRINVNGSVGPTDTQTVATDGMPRPESLTVTAYCADFSISGPVPARTVNQGDPAGLSVTAPAGSSFQWYSGEAEITNETGPTLNVIVNQTSSYWVRVANGACTIDSVVSVVTVAACSGTPTMSVPSSVKLGTSRTASVAESGTYAWTIQNGTITPPTNTQSITFTAGCSGSVTLTVSFTPACGGSATSASKTVPITVPTVTASASPATIAQGNASTLTATASGTGPWTIRWADDAAAGATRNVTPNGTTTYQVQQVNGCSVSPSWASVTVTVVPPAPLTTTATRSGSNSVLVTWTKAANATIDSYRIERCTISCSGGGTWTLAGTSAGMSFTDSGRTVNRTYVYRVKAVRSGTFSTSASPPDFASTFTFSDDPITIGTPVNAAHISELRSAIDSLRGAAGLSAYNYTWSIAAGSMIEAVHLTQLRDSANGARLAFGKGSVAFTESTPAAGVVIRASHVSDLRGGVQ